MIHFRRLFPALLAALLMAVPVSAQDKISIATVNMQELVKQYYRTAQIEKQMVTEQEGIKEANDERLARIRDLEDQMETLGKRIEDPTTSDKKRQELLKERQVKLQEGVALERERVEFLKRRNQALKEKFAQSMQSIYTDISKLVGEQAKLGNYDYIFDKSGNSVAQVPFLLYSKDKSDITEELVKILNKDAPAGSTEEGNKPSE